MSTEEVKKKRGRKKKVVDPIVEESVNTSLKTEVSPAVASEKPKSRRGRKTKAVVNAYDVGNGVNNMSDDENIIVKLNIRTTDSVDVIMENNHISPNAYDAHNSFESTPQYLQYHESAHSDHENTDFHDNHVKPSDPKDLRVVELLKDFEMKNKMSEWPQSTSISCYWCCHPFNTVPFGIPVKFYNEKFHVFGCFCSLECAAAFNFNSKESSDEIWERNNLMNLLSRKLGYKPVIKPAPSRLSLKMFGGHLDIDTFRQYFDSKKILNINFPPMMTMTQQIEEINECDINSEYRFIPLDNERINKYKEKLTLKRSKPLTNYKHTLDHMMNLKINDS
jgi:hypothetical protein